MKPTITKLPIGITPLKTRWMLSKELIRIAVQVLIGQEWTRNIAYKKKLKIIFNISVK